MAIYGECHSTNQFCLFLCLPAHKIKVAVLPYFEPFLNYMKNVQNS